MMNKLTTSQLDEYLDWAESTLIDPEPHRKGGLPKQLLDMFPTSRLDGSSAKELSFEEEIRTDQVSSELMLESCMKGLKLRSICPEDGEGEEGRRRLGSFYKRYHKAEDLTPSARKFYEAVASLLNVTVNTLLGAVLQVERKLQGFVRDEQKKERAINQGVEGAQGGGGYEHHDGDDDDDGVHGLEEEIGDRSPPPIKRERSESKYGNGEEEEQGQMQVVEGEASGIRPDDGGDDDNDQSTLESPMKSFHVKKELRSDTDDDKAVMG